jgi:hypothetical protein
MGTEKGAGCDGIKVKIAEHEIESGRLLQRSSANNRRKQGGKFQQRK